MLINSHLLVGDTLINIDELIVWGWAYIISVPIAILKFVTDVGDTPSYKTPKRRVVPAKVNLSFGQSTNNEVVKNLRKSLGYTNDNTSQYDTQTICVTQPVQKAASPLAGPEMVGDLNDYEYISDGKRLCFMNIHTGNKVSW